MDKYKWKNRIILAKFDDNKNKKYLNFKKLYEKNIKEFHKRYIKLVYKKNKNNKIELIGFDGSLKKTYLKIDNKICDKIFKLVDKMPMAKKKFKPVNLSLYSDYHPKKSKKNLGYGSKEKAKMTLKNIKNKPLNYQKSVISTMLGRAKYHKYRTDGMKDATKIFQAWLKKH